MSNNPNCVIDTVACAQCGDWRGEVHEIPERALRGEVEEFKKLRSSKACWDFINARRLDDEVVINSYCGCH